MDFNPVNNDGFSQHVGEIPGSENKPSENVLERLAASLRDEDGHKICDEDLKLILFTWYTKYLKSECDRPCGEEHTYLLFHLQKPLPWIWKRKTRR